MLTVTRVTKQLIIAGIVVAVLGGGGWFVVRTISPPTPSPTPDFTIKLKPLVVVSSKLFAVGQNDYDFLARVRNPNADYGSGDAQYELIGYWDGTGGVSNSRVVRTGSLYILPGQSKYIVIPHIATNFQLTRAELKVKSVEWQEVDPLISSGANLVVVNAVYIPRPAADVFGKVGGAIVNNSEFDINKIDVPVVVFGASNNPVAVGKTDIRTFMARTTRGFEVAWYVPFSGTPERVEAEAHFNAFENDALLRAYGAQERFQELY